MHAVTAILRRYLLQHIPVAIEGIGTLRTVRSGAQFLQGQRMEPPRRIPELVVDDMAGAAMPLTELVVTELTVDPVTADGICRQWREEAFVQGENGAMWLEGVGTIAFGSHAYEGKTAFYADPSLLELLNPLPAEPLVIPTATVRPRMATPTPNRNAAGAVRQHRTPRVRPPKGRNPHNYTVSFLAVLVVLAALGYLCYYLWAHTDILSDFLPR